MSHRLPALSAALLLLAAACSVETTLEDDDVTAIQDALELDDGGMTMDAEAPAFGDEEQFTAIDDFAEVADATPVEVAAGLDRYRVVLIWGSLARGETPAYTDGGCSYVDVRDVARVHRLVLERGAPGERYLATAHNLSNKDFFQTIARIAGTGQRFPWIPTRVARGYIRLLAAIAIRRGQDPLLSPAMFDYSCRPPYFDNRRSIEELGASYRPIEETIEDAIAYFRARGRL